MSDQALGPELKSFHQASEEQEVHTAERRRSYIGAIVAAIAIGLLFYLARNAWGGLFARRGPAVVAFVGGLLFFAERDFRQASKREKDKAASYAIVLSVQIFVLIGLTAVILACQQWAIGLLLAGACLLMGGFVGLLFGYPQGAAQQVAAQGAVKPQDGTGGTRVANKNLVAESAATLGKVITGFTLAKLGSTWSIYSSLCHNLGPALGSALPQYDAVLAGVMIAYFLATGFVAGLLLPPFFMGNNI